MKNEGIIDYFSYKIEINAMKNDYLKYVKSCKSDGTYSCYFTHLDSVINWFFERNLIFNKKNFLSFIEFCHNKNLNNKTINYKLVCLRAMFKYSNCENDICFLKKLSVIDKPFDYLNSDELQEFKNYILTSDISVKNKLVLSLLFDTGVRRHELIKIETSNIDLKKRIILLTETKTKKIRYVFYTEKYLLEVYDIKNKYLLNYKEQGIYNIFLRAKKNLPFLKLHPHMLRHSLATDLLKKGADLESVRKILGHSSIKQTQQYLHLDLDYVKSVYDRIMN